MEKQRSKLRVFCVLLLVLAMVLSMAACGQDNNVSQSSQSTSSVQQSDTGTSAPANEEKVDPLGKYDPAIELTTGRSSQWRTFDPGRSIDDNQYYDAYLNNLGIKVKNDWVVNSDELFTSKVNVAIASGAIPDVLGVSAQQLQNLVEAGMVEDLTEAYDKYASEDMKKFLSEDGGNALKAGSYGGKLYGLPSTTSSVDYCDVLWIRNDWLKKLNLQPPKSMDEVYNIAKAFTENDPDGNSKNDTLGLGLSKEFQVWGSPNIAGFFAGYHANIGSWVKNSSGRLVYGTTVDEMKPALAKLAEMYKAGYIDQEFGVKEAPKVFESISSGKIGMYFGDLASPLYASVGSFKNDPNVEWNAYPIPTVDGKTVKVQLPPTASTFQVVRKGYEHPEAIVKLMNFWIDKNYINVDVALSRNQETNVLYYLYAIVTANPMYQNHNAHLQIADAVKTGDISKLGQDAKYYYDKIQLYKKDPKNNTDPKIVEGWSLNRTFGVGNSGQEIVEQYIKDDSLQITAFLGGSTPAMAEKMATLNKMEAEMMIKIILGQEGTDEFDNFVADWYKQGGEQITKEVNAWAAAAAGN